jgi:hypothetical protein
MAFIRCVTIIIAFSFFCIKTGAQTVFYPAGASQLLKATAADMAALLQKATGSNTVAAMPYTSMPASGIVLAYDTTITHNQSCKIESNGSSLLRFSASQDNGLVFGMYNYLRQLGFRFYQPGSIWEVIPSLSSVYKNINTTVTGNFKYRTWFISGGHNRWVMDNNTSYSWDTYFGNNGHNWALYQRRNGMGGAHRFAGHRTDIISGSYLTTIQNNPCYVACYNGTRQAGLQSVPDVNNSNATALWSNALEKKYTQYRNTIYGNPTLYANFYRNFSFNNGLVGLEVPDGAQWGNSKDNNCGNSSYAAESDQQFTLANTAAAKISTVHPGVAFQCYAYSSHANTPATSIAINSKLDVQVIPTAFQQETSAKGLMNRWYKRHGNISEYHYLNIPQWGGETPMFYKTELESTLARLKEKTSQGISWEASPAKFASLPWLLAANNSLQYNIITDSTLNDFCHTMFGAAASKVHQLLQLWADEKTITTGDYIPDNKYKIPLYLQLVKEADALVQNAAPVVKQRLAELKAYLHYMVLYYDWLYDQRSHDEKQAKAAQLCLYLASIHQLQLVNSYFIITDIASRYETGSSFYMAYNSTNGTAYQNGNLPLITNAIIESNFTADLAAMGSLVSQYQLRDAVYIKTKMAGSNIAPAQKITVKIGYTNGYNYPNRSEYYIDAPAAGAVSIQYTPKFLMPDRGYINFTVEAVDKALLVVKDFSLDRTSGSGTLNIQLPEKGVYKLTVTSKYKSSVDLVITTNGNYFYKNTAFLGNKTENYRTNLLSLPGFFYVPEGMQKLYFSINNSNPGGKGFATPDQINTAFVFKDNNGNTIKAMLAGPGDSALFYIPIPASGSGSFWQVVKMEQYNLCFANTSNVLWFATKKPCTNAGFVATIVSKNNTCITQLTALTPGAAYRWEVYDLSKWFYYDTRVAELPNYISPNAIVTLKMGTNCYTTQRLGDDEKYLRQKEACASGTPVAAAISEIRPVLYPNPSNGIFSFMQDGKPIQFEEMTVTDCRGIRMAIFKNNLQFNISNFGPGVYFYSSTINGAIYKGKLVKL